MDTVGIYNKMYSSLNFERKGLFELLSQMFPVEKVLYPGCSVHITPSFFFQNVVYIDQSQLAVKFFSDAEKVRTLIGMHKVYRQAPYFSFLEKDYRQIEETSDYQYDILISLYADDVVEICQSLIRQGGIAVSNNFHDEVLRLMRTRTMDLIGRVVGKNSRYTYISDLDIKVNHREEDRIQKTCMRNTANGVQYFDNETYYVLRKRY